MRTKILKPGTISCLIGLLTAQLMFAQETPQLGKHPMESVINAMTIEEKAHLLIGTGMAGMNSNSSAVGQTQILVPGSAGTTYPIPRLGIPSIVLADGPAGLRIAPLRDHDPNTYYCTGFPVGSLLASTWNTELVENTGKAMGNEVLEYGVDVLLAPAMNIHRNPLCGRNFEYYSEDPVVTGKIAAAMVKGIQSNGVGTSIKHFAANNQETNRMNNDARVAPRAMREIYLKGFEIAVKEAQPWTVMSSYNYINGIYTSENKTLLTDILRQEWGFKGVVMSDWLGGKHTVAQIEAGNDLLQPGQAYQYEELVTALKNGQLSMADANISIARILELVVRSPRFNKYSYSNKPDLKAHADVARKSAAEGMVLLKNDNATLPLTVKTKNIAAFGITSYDFIAGGTGSGDVNKAYTISLTDGLKNAGYRIDKTISSTYANYRLEELAKLPKDESPFAQFMPKKPIEEIVPSTELLDHAVKVNDIALITIGRSSGEFFDRKVDSDFNLSENEQKLINVVCDAFQKKGKKVIVILNIGGVIETASWKSKPDAILLAGQAGQEAGNAVADALYGKTNPSGKLTDTYPMTYADAWSSENFPKVISDNQFDMSMITSTGMVKNEKRNIDYTVYAEGIYVGYRYFEKFNIPVSYPFGYGLSYTSFEYSNATLIENNGGYSATVTIKNTGKYPGKEVVQLYVAAPESKYADKPVKELKAFAKTAVLKPGESETITLKYTKADLASFNTLEQAWITDAGKYKAQIGASSVDMKVELPFEISNTEWMEKVNKAF
ncbi:beta-glucosidase [Breznakibacter xylanolyticus]|uniref:Beta-glucosidase n=1 Tax=Breznakibacter xylanolyticus TaxID=990 RepID=A0A2W7MSP7_9BACT|nr:glycoside hydrolase family 3 N-terminal domain-containing protein [Breznakibacter xylanolyticus]PZX10573.1 beta-glucosidase [Breznakibacter xylanolyticus]